MAVKIYKGGAWVTPTGIKKYDSGKWVNCQFIKRYVNGAWVDVWRNGKTLSLFTTNLGTGAVYNLTPSADGKSLSYSLTGGGDHNNSISLAVYNPNGFGNSVDIRYTLNQTVPITGYGGTYWLGDDYVTTVINHYNSIASPTNFHNTISVNNPTVLYLLLDIVHGYTLSGTISNIYINDEEILFSL